MRDLTLQYQKLEDFLERGIILHYEGPLAGPFMAQKGPKALRCGPALLKRDTLGALAIAVAAWWEPGVE